MTGVVARIVEAKGFGFVKDAAGVEYFFHRSACGRGVFDALRQGDTVAFDAETSAKGPRATNIRQE